MKSRLLAVLVFSAASAFAGDAAFEHIVKAIETHYGTHPVHVPFMGLASFVLKVAHPEGATGFKLAIFEDLKSSPAGDDWSERDRFMRSVSGAGLCPVVQVHSRGKGEVTYIFMNPASKSGRILVATFEPDEAVVVEVQADLAKVLGDLDHPQDAGHYRGE